MQPKESQGSPGRPPSSGGSGRLQRGDGYRDDLAQNSPVGFSMACDAFGDTPNMADPEQRAAFFAVWSVLQYEFADAMLAARED